MKTLKHIFQSIITTMGRGGSILSLTLMILFTSMHISGHSQTDGNYLKLKGNILGKYKAQVQVFAYVESADKWVTTYDKSNRSRYCLILDPQTNYQVWFSTTEGQTKILHIGAGDKGPWHKYLDIDFSDEGSSYAYMQQVYPEWDYVLMPVEHDFRPMLNKVTASINLESKHND